MFYLNTKKQLIFSGDFNLIYDKHLEASRKNPTIKTLSLGKLIEFNEGSEYC